MRAVLTALVVCLGVTALPAMGADFIWLEGEKPTSVNVDAKYSGWGNTQYLSEGNWINFIFSEAEVPQKVPAEGALIRYDFQAPAAGRYEAWNRIGYEFIRSPFDWRIDDGPWSTIKTEDITTDLMDLAQWNEVAWMPLGEVQLTAGKHTFEVRIQRPAADAKDKRIVYASDVIGLFPFAFHPNSKFKPGEDWQTDADRAAAQQVFQMPAVPGDAERITLPLAGRWQVTRFDEGLVEGRTEPIPALPEPDACFWRAATVPADKFSNLPQLNLCHRLVYRARVDVPAAYRGRSFVLRLPSFSLMATVFVNGVRCGFSKTPLAPWDCDITGAVKPGQVNEICVGIKDFYYAVSEEIAGRNARYSFNVPTDRTNNQGFTMQFDFPVALKMASGILETPSIVACGPVYVADVFAMPSVKRNELALEVTLHNPGAASVAGQAEVEVVPAEGGAAVLTMPAARVEVPAGADATLKQTAPWADPHLWWPDDPYQYDVVTRLRVNGQVVDVQRTRFGFREWEWNGPRFVLNGVPWQGRADCDWQSGPTPEETVRIWQDRGQTMMRFWGQSWFGLDQPAVLNLMDRMGMPVRRSGCFDGEMASYRLVLGNGPDRHANKPLFDNWIEQMVAQVKGERNHPSVFIWSIENEIAYINSRNLGLKQWTEPELTRCAQAVMAIDPTRPVMVDGGRALMDESLPVNGCHYEETAQRDYPDRAYVSAYDWGDQGGAQPWPMSLNKPVFLGESYYARGNAGGWFAGVGGESAFLGKSGTVAPAGLFARMLSEGYRWQGLAAFHFWLGSNDANLHYAAWKPVCVLCRQWNWTFGSGTTVPRTLKVFNDTRYADPIEMAWQLNVGGKTVQQGTKTYSVAPGEAQEDEISLQLPTVAARTEGELVLTCSRGGKEAFREAKPLSVLPPAGPTPQVSASDLLVVDPDGSLRAYLTARGVPFTAVDNADALPEEASGKTILVGRNALTSRQATSPRWVSLVASGAHVAVLEQQAPLRYQALPADLEPTTFVGRIGFIENPSHPVFAGLDQPDFFTWSGDHILYRNVYRKASKGALSLVQCEPDLSCSAVAQCTVGDGLLVLCQLVVGEKLAADPVAQRLFDNILAYCVTYKPVRKTCAVIMDADSPAGKLLAASGLQYDAVTDPVAAVTDGKHQIVIVQATPENLAALAANTDRVRSFAQSGGWLMLWGLTAEGLSDFSKLVGVEHLIRPFEMERVTLAPVRDALAAGLTMRDVAMESGERIFSWMGDRWMADDEFTNVVDVGDDIAPFGTFPGPEYWGVADAAPRSQNWPRNMVSGFTFADAWKYSFYMGATPRSAKWPIKLPRAETIRRFSIQLSTIYRIPSKVKLTFDGDEGTAVVLSLADNDERQDFDLTPRKAQTITVELQDWAQPDKPEVLIVSNLWLTIERSPEFTSRVTPLLNVGGLVKYPIGTGGIFLNQLRIQEREANPVNGEKKQAIVSTILRNMQATFAATRSTLPGSGMAFAPVDLGDHCNAFLLKDKGWFDRNRDLSHFPVGESKPAGVPFMVRDFKTSPLPSCIILGGAGAQGSLPRELTGIAVGRQADALFFLHTYLERRTWSPQPRNPQPPPVLFEYVVHFTDGQVQRVPVRYHDGVGPWVSKDPAGMRNAAAAWAAPFPNDTSGDQAVVYQMQWTNPLPEVPISSVDMVIPDDEAARYGTPALLAITTGKLP
jgi:hypothetical protein